MRQKFSWFYHLYVAFFVSLLLWSVWSQAQEALTPGTTNTVVNLTDEEVAQSDLEKKSALKPLLTFGLDRIEVLRHQAGGIPLWQYFASLLYLILALVVAKFLDYIIRIYLSTWAKKSATRVDDILLGLVHGPIKVISFVFFLHIGFELFAWPLWVEKVLSKTFSLVMAFSITYMVLKLVDVLMEFWLSRNKQGDPGRFFDERLFPIIRKSLKVFVVIVGALFTAQNVFDQNITAILASLSIGGLAVGLAAQDTLANLFGAVAVFVDKPFVIGDRIQLDRVDGVVEAIGLRSTRVRSLDGHVISIPNKAVGNATIINITLRPTIKTVIDFEVSYELSAEKIEEAVSTLKAIYKAHPNTGDLIVSFNQFRAHGLNINVVHWWNNTNVREHIEGMQQLNLQVKRAFDEKGIEFAFPTRTIYMKGKPAE